MDGHAGRGSHKSHKPSSSMRSRKRRRSPKPGTSNSDDGAAKEVKRPRLSDPGVTDSGRPEGGNDDSISAGKQIAESGSKGEEVESDFEGEEVERERTGAHSGPSKRKKLDDIAASDEKRYQDNADANTAALKKIYAMFYKNGKKRPSVKGKVYTVLTYGDSEYLRKPITAQEFAAFAAGNEHRTVDSQLVKLNQAKSLQDAFKRGDYFFAYNTHFAQEKTSPDRRRIIVNVKTQEAALKAAERLNDLYAVQDISPFIESYKIYLSARAKPSTTSKYDKLVVYYHFDGADDATDDKVGDKIAATLEAAVPLEERETAFAPFYSKVTEGIAWGEEPEKRNISFSQVRSDIITNVIDKNPDVDDPDTFVRLVNEALKQRGVDPEAPHRHLTQTKD